jgi:hypothetical protein
VLVKAFRPFLILCVAILLLFAAGFVGLRETFGRAAEDAVTEGEIVDFDQPKAIKGSHRFLVCPKTMCAGQANLEARIYPVGWETLRDAFKDVVAETPHVHLVAGDGDLRKITFIEHTPLLMLPDIITVEFIEIDESHSTLALDRHSRYRFAAWGRNRARVLAWLAALDQALVAPSG